MPRISLAQSEVIKRRLFRAREHLQCLGKRVSDPNYHQRLQAIADATYEFNQGLRLPAVKHLSLGQGKLIPAAEYYDDALQNLSRVIDTDLSQLNAHPTAQDEAIVTAQSILEACQQIPLPVAS